MKMRRLSLSDCRTLALCLGLLSVAFLLVGAAGIGLTPKWQAGAGLTSGCLLKATGPDALTCATAGTDYAIPDPKWLTAAGCNNGAAAGGFDLPSSNFPT